MNPITLDRVLRLPAEEGGTVCRVRTRRVDQDLVVVVSELADNPGLSIERNFGPVATRVRSWLPSGCEPLWLEHWPARALALLVLHDVIAPTTHVRQRGATGWSRSPLPARAIRELVGYNGS